MQKNHAYKSQLGFFPIDENIFVISKMIFHRHSLRLNLYFEGSPPAEEP
jgi:hypothetical protein